MIVGPSVWGHVNCTSPYVRCKEGCCSAQGDSGFSSVGASVHAWVPQRGEQEGERGRIGEGTDDRGGERKGGGYLEGQTCPCIRGAYKEA